MNNRWKMNRIGFVNFWLYDEEIFSFSDGKLLLRGANASGKSITTQSFIPFILDGDRTPSRLDPFGSSDRKMEYYFLGNSDKDDVTGYLFLEFKKGDSKQYRTIGIGQRAQKGKPMDFWGFVILDGKRVGHDFNLYKEVGSKKIPYSRQELEKAIGEDNLTADKQGEYMRLVNKHIFGFPRIEQYDQFIRLMIKVRAPKLSRDFKPTKVYEILNESLQTLSDEDLRAMVDAMEKMDDIQNKLDSLNAALKDVQSIRREYDNYNRYMLSKKSGAYLAVKKQVEYTRGKLDAYSTEVESKTEEKNIKEEENTQLGLAITILEKEKEILDATDLESSVEKLENRKTQKINDKVDVDTYHKKLESHRQTLIEYSLEQRRCQNDVEAYQHEIDKMLSDLDNLNETLQYENHIVMKEAIRRSNVHNQFNDIKKELRELSDGIAKGLIALQAFQKMEEEWSKSEEALSRISILKSGCEEQQKTAEGMEHQLKDSLVEGFYILAEKFKELVIGKQELDLIISRIMKYEGAKDIGSIREIVDGAKIRKEKIFLENQAKSKVKREDIYEKCKTAKQELEELKNTKEPVPKRRDKVTNARNILAKENITCLPLYEALEFQETLSGEEQAMLEEQLLDTGLLDSLIVAESDYARAKLVLSSLSDSLIQVKQNVHSGYRKLVVGDVMPKLRETVVRFLDSIYDQYAEEAVIVLSADGYYRNGVIEGHSIPEEEASFVGVVARRNRLDRMIAEKELEYSGLEEQLKECDEMIESIRISIQLLNEEYQSLPGFSDLDEAIDLVKDASYEVKKATAEYAEKEKELSAVLGQKKVCEQNVMKCCRALPYERTLVSYEEVSNDSNDYKEGIIELEKEANYLETSKSKCDNIEALIDKEEEVVDSTDLQLKKAEEVLRICEAEIVQLEEFLNSPENKERAEKLTKVNEELKDNSQKLAANREAIAGLLAIINVRQDEIVVLNAEVVEAIGKEVKVRAYFQEELGLKLVLEQGNRTILESANEAIGCIRESDKNKSVGDTVASLYRVYQQHSSNLTNYATALEDCFEDDSSDSDLLRKRKRIVSTSQGKKLYLEEFYIVLKQSIESTELLIGQKDRELFEDILADTLSRKLSNRIAESKHWIVDMSKLMLGMDTSMGLTFSLDWKPRAAEGEKELDTQELEKLLSRDRELLTPEDIDKVSLHFRSKIQVAKQVAEENGDTANYADMVRDALDYRKWFEFRMYFYRNGVSKKELTNSAFNKFSGGEKAMAMYIPLFAAVNAQYKKSDNPNHPRIVALDEAFAGVDDKNISSMFELVETLDFDYIMNSQALWGCYETVKSLKIAELLRPANSDVVTAIYYYWNGLERILEEQ